MKVGFFSAKPYERQFFDRANQGRHELKYLEPRLTPETALLAADQDAVCVFVNDCVNREVLEQLASLGVRYVALRSAGFNHVDLAAADELGMPVVRVPAYSPHAVAEHTVGLMLALNRHLHRAASRVREGNFSLNGLLGFDLHGRTVGVVGTGKIGAIVVRILSGFGCRVLAFDPYPNPECLQLGAKYVQAEELLAESEIITLHCPLSPQSHHLVNKQRIEQMRPGVMLINTSRGALVDTAAVIDALKSGQIGYLGIDVYEEEADLFFEDLSNQVIKDDVFARLLTFPNVLITGHQAFFTREALEAIAATTLANLDDVVAGRECANAVHAEKLVAAK